MKHETCTALGAFFFAGLEDLEALEGFGTSVVSVWVPLPLSLRTCVSDSCKETGGGGESFSTLAFFLGGGCEPL